MNTVMVLAMLEAKRGKGRAIVAVDGDGTLWKPDMGYRFVGAHLEHRWTRPEALAGLQRLATAHQVDLNDDVHKQLRALTDGYFAGKLPPASAYAIGALMLTGQTPEGARRRAEGLLLDDDFRVFEEWMEVLDWSKRVGLELWVVSAGSWPMAAAAAAKLGVAPERVIGTRPHVKDGRYDSALRCVPFGPSKTTVLAKETGGAPVVAAFGNDVGDLHMMRGAGWSVSVRPTNALRLAAPHLATWNPGRCA